MSRKTGLWVIPFLAFLTCAAPAWLFFNPTERVVHRPLADYRLHNDDFTYIGGSRTWSRTWDNLLVPHNAHVVPAWRVLTGGLVAYAGKLSSVPEVFAFAAFAILMVVLLQIGILTASETGRWAPALGAMAFAGTTSVLWSPVTWYSAGQTLWAAAGILASLRTLQLYRLRGGTWRLAVAAGWAMVAGGFWTIGHAAGPVGAVYLWFDGRPRCRKAAVVPLAVSVVWALFLVAVGARQMDSTISFHGRTVTQAASPGMGILHTLQAIPENLIFGNLGVDAPIAGPLQGALLTFALGFAWAATWRSVGFRPNPLEAAGATLMILAYLVEWTVRGYLPFSSLRNVVPWYDAIPHVGFILFLVGWWAVPTSPGEAARPVRLLRAERPTWAGALGLMVLTVGLVALHTPRSDRQLIESVPPMTDLEKRYFRIPELIEARASLLANLRMLWQRSHLRKMEQVEALGRKLGFGREQVREAVGRVDVPELPRTLDALDMLDLPASGAFKDVAAVRAAIGNRLVVEPEPSVDWEREFGYRPAP